MLPSNDRNSLIGARFQGIPDDRFCGPRRRRRRRRCSSTSTAERPAQLSSETKIEGVASALSSCTTKPERRADGGVRERGCPNDFPRCTTLRACVRAGERASERAVGNVIFFRELYTAIPSPGRHCAALGTEGGIKNPGFLGMRTALLGNSFSWQCWQPDAGWHSKATEPKHVGVPALLDVVPDYI